jgi:hypothetical protein
LTKEFINRSYSKKVENQSAMRKPVKETTNGVGWPFDSKLKYIN